MKVYLRNWQRGSIVPFLLGAVLGSCAPDEICFSDNTTLVQLEFLTIQYEGTDSAEVVNDTLIFNSITAQATDSVFVEGDTLAKLALPVNTADTVTWFLFDSDRGMDSLQLSYRVFRRLISEECGPEQIFDELNLGSTSFDSVVIIAPLLNQQIAKNVEVYY